MIWKENLNIIKFLNTSDIIKKMRLTRRKSEKKKIACPDSSMFIKYLTVHYINATSNWDLVSDSNGLLIYQGERLGKA